MLEIGPWPHHSRKGCEKQCRSQGPPEDKFYESVMHVHHGRDGIESVCFEISWKGGLCLAGHPHQSPGEELAVRRVMRDRQLMRAG